MEGARWDESEASHTFLPSVPESPLVWSDVNLGPNDDTALYKMKGWYLEIMKSWKTEAFEEEIHRIRKGKQLLATSNILALTLILDSGGVFRIGCRAERTQLHSYQLHPLLSFGKHPFAESVVRAFHGPYSAQKSSSI